MPTSPPSEEEEKNFTNYAQEWVVLIGPQNGTNPTMANEVDYLIPLSCSVSATGARDDVLTFSFLQQPRLMDIYFPLGVNCQAELRALDEDGYATIILGWGMICRTPVRVDQESEDILLEARIGDEHFGYHATQYPTWDVRLGAASWVEHPIVFNPEIDDIIRPNRSNFFDPVSGAFYMQDWESSWTNTAVLFQQSVPQFWSLTDIVIAICTYLNPDQTFITNPTYAYLNQSTVFAGNLPEVANIKIPFGASLPDALDAILNPFEISWYLAHQIDETTNQMNGDGEQIPGTGNRYSYIVFFKRGVGPTKEFAIQRPIQNLDLGQTNVASWDATYSVNNLANWVECYGEFEKREATFLLAKGWAINLDQTSLQQLAIGQPLNKTNPEIGRRWVLNEAGDYLGLRPEITMPDLSGLGFTALPTVRRRKFFKCLSQHNDGNQLVTNGFYVEWWNPFAPNANPPDGWQDITNPGWERIRWPFAILDKECGIYFEGDTPPEKLWNLISNPVGERGEGPAWAQVRITCSIMGDTRVRAIAARQGTSANIMNMRLTLDVSDKFQNSVITNSSIFLGSPSEARDDSTAIQTYANAVQAIEDYMRIDSSSKLIGAVHPEFSIGDVIIGIGGRNISMAQTPNGRFPQIVGFNWDLQDQSVEVLLESHHKERPRVVHQVVGGRHEAKVIGAGTNRPQRKLKPRALLKPREFHQNENGFWE